MAKHIKIFINDVPLILAEQGYVPEGKKPEETSIDFEKGLVGFLNGIIDNGVTHQLLASVISTDAALSEIKNQLPTIVAAGGLVWNPANGLLMIFRRGKWDLPKGKLDPGEDTETAAIREVMEETGVKDLLITDKLSVMHYIYREGKNLFLKEIHWYNMRCKDASPLVPQTIEGITKAEWVSKDEISIKLQNTYESIRDLVATILK